MNINKEIKLALIMKVRALVTYEGTEKYDKVEEVVDFINKHCEVEQWTINKA